MRHGKSGRKLKRSASHRKATLASLATALLRHKRITTTVAKAKETRKVVERMITRARHSAALPLKDAKGVHDRRLVGRLVKDRAVIGELFSTIATRVGARPGGYTRIVKLGQRKGDGAEMAVIELVDFNTGQEEEKSAPKEKKARAAKKNAKSKDETKPSGNKTEAAAEKVASPSDAKEPR